MIATEGGSLKFPHIQVDNLFLGLRLAFLTLWFLSLDGQTSPLA